ncbi:MAG TPA: hypothetical protein VKQ52_06455 [Puia sp.]|nr:hypothetical protein [Puia sp.]
MKEMILLLCGIVIGRQLMAQTFSEWFRQNHTQLKYLAELIAALRSYDGLLQKGYATARDGLGDIWDIGEEDLDLHSEHFAELDVASPGVQADATVETIQQYCAWLPAIAEKIEAIWAGQSSQPMYFPEWGLSISGGLRYAAEISRRSLADILAAGRYQMDDAERMRILSLMSLALKNLYGKAVLLLTELDWMTINHSI